MQKYYFEYPIGHGNFEAENDDKAILKVKDNVFLYKESDTKDGLPFVVVKNNYHE